MFRQCMQKKPVSKEEAERILTDSNMSSRQKEKALGVWNSADMHKIAEKYNIVIINKKSIRRKPCIIREESVCWLCEKATNRYTCLWPPELPDGAQVLKKSVWVDGNRQEILTIIQQCPNFARG